MNWLRYILVAVIAYLLGNFSTGVVVSKTFAHTDIRTQGSGNAGATNVLRTYGWLPSVLTLVGDALKAIIAALLGRAIAGDTGMQIAGVATVIGHNWPVFYHFKGGKGIACSLGFIIVSSPWIALALVAEQVVITAITRYMSVASIVSGVLYPTLTAIFHPHDTGLIIASALIGALAVFSHRGNIARLIHGTENRLDFKKIKTISQKTMAKLKNRPK